MIDGHVHIWTMDAARYPWHQTLSHVPIPDKPAEAEQLIAEMDATGVEQALLVQPSVYGWDNSYLCDTLARWPTRFAGVCLVDPRSADAPDKLSYWIEERGCSGLRVNLIAESDASWILDDVRRKLWTRADELGVSISVQMRPAIAPVLVELAVQFPRTTFVVDYLGGDAFHDGSGIAAVDRLAAADNIRFKMQPLGLDSKRPLPFDDLWPLYNHAYRKFGSTRLIFGTDFPHVYRTSTYAEGIDWFARLPFLDDDARKAIGHDNAAGLWNFAG